MDCLVKLKLLSNTRNLIKYDASIKFKNDCDSRLNIF